MINSSSRFLYCVMFRQMSSSSFNKSSSELPMLDKLDSFSCSMFCPSPRSIFSSSTPRVSKSFIFRSISSCSRLISWAMRNLREGRSWEIERKVSQMCLPFQFSLFRCLRHCTKFLQFISWLVGLEAAFIWRLKTKFVTFYLDWPESSATHHQIFDNSAAAAESAALALSRQSETPFAGISARRQTCCARQCTAESRPSPSIANWRVGGEKFYFKVFVCGGGIKSDKGGEDRKHEP